jgi:phage terminase small subunit
MRNPILDPAKVSATKPASRTGSKRRDSPMRDLFAREYLKDFNATQAAVRAGYSRKTAASQGQRLLKSARIGTAIARHQAKLLKKEHSSVENIVRALAAIAFLDPGQLFNKNGALLPMSRIPEEARRGLTGFKIKELFDSDSGKERYIGRRYKLDFTGKIKALAVLGKYLKMFPKTDGVAGKRGKPWNPAEQMSIEQVRHILDSSTSESQTPLKPPPPKLVAKPPSRAGMKGRGSFMRDRFSIEYLKDFNATQAAVRAGYSAKTAASQGQRLLKSAAVGEAIAEATERLLKKNEVTVERVLEELAEIAFLDPIVFFDDNGHLLPINNIPENARRALASFTVEESCDCDGHRRGKTHVGFGFCSKLAALELLGKIERRF